MDFPGVRVHQANQANRATPVNREVMAALGVLEALEVPGVQVGTVPMAPDFTRSG
jgi:hypothetical protein